MRATEKFENSSHSTGCSTRPLPTSAWLTRPFLPQQGQPRDHADHVRGPERDRADDEEQRLCRRRADVEGDEVGEREAEHQRHRPGCEREAQRRPVGLQRHAGLGQVGAAGEDGLVVGEGEAGLEVVVAGRPQAHRADQQQAARRRRTRTPPRTAAPAARPAGRMRAGSSSRPARRDRAQAATNSFHFWTMYVFSSISAFQQAMPPMRCSYEPPSRDAAGLGQQVAVRAT